VRSERDAVGRDGQRIERGCGKEREEIERGVEAWYVLFACFFSVAVVGACAGLCRTCLLKNVFLLAVLGFLYFVSVYRAFCACAMAFVCGEMLDRRT
jgi:hypothetical protein